MIDLKRFQESHTKLAEMTENISNVFGGQWACVAALVVAIDTLHQVGHAAISRAATDPEGAAMANSIFCAQAETTVKAVYDMLHSLLNVPRAEVDRIMGEEKLEQMIQHMISISAYGLAIKGGQK